MNRMHEDHHYLSKLCFRVKACRKLAGLSQTALAKKAGISRNMIVGIENGTMNPSYLTLVAIAEALEVLLKELIPKN